MRAINSVYFDDKCIDETCRFCETEKEQCSILKDTHFKGKPCPFKKPRKNEKSR